MLNASQSVSFPAADGKTVYGESFPVKDSAKPLILLFHQAGSNHAEYNPIAPRLNKLGFSALAIDQRSGGSMWDTRNRTSTQYPHKPDYPDALADLEAAVRWAKTKNPNGVIVWGSSYSAALVFLLASKHPEAVRAVLAFSPGEYLGGPDLVVKAAANVTCPVFIDSAKDTQEIAAAKLIFDAVASHHKTQFEPVTAGVHGSSTLRTDRNEKGADENWKAVESFLTSL